MNKPVRYQSIDVFRAITMLLMVFVNDLDPIGNVPEWIKHVGQDTDGLGFADTIFPAFLFIVGLSIPFAINGRLKRGIPARLVAVYILTRSLALLVMGFFQVNLDDYSSTALLPRPLWEICITTGFFLIWLDYPQSMLRRRRIALQGSGILLLALMALLFKGETDAHTTTWLRFSWWGILGLIGWTYLLCSSLFLWSKGRLPVLLAATVFFLLFNIGYHTTWLDSLEGIEHYVWIVGSGSLPVFTMAGVIVSVLYTRSAAAGKLQAFSWKLLPVGAAIIATGFLLRPLDGISKIHATPAWVGICTGISLLAFAFFIWLVDIRKRQHWFNAVMPAGTSTLTCYLVPYLLYSGYILFGFRYPHLLNQGTGGLLRSMLVAMVVVLFTGLLEKARLRLKI